MGLWDDINKGADDMWEMEELEGLEDGTENDALDKLLFFETIFDDEF